MNERIWRSFDRLGWCEYSTDGIERKKNPEILTSRHCQVDLAGVVPRPTFSRISHPLSMRFIVRTLAAIAISATALSAQGTRLLRDPSLGPTQIVFTYGGDLWVVGRQGGEARRLTSTPAVDENPQFSPDGKWIAFTSNRAGGNAVYVVAAEGGDPRRLTWSPAGESARGWTPDGRRVLFASSRVSAPTAYDKLWTIPLDGGPAQLLPAYMGFRGSFSPDGKRIVVDRRCTRESPRLAALASDDPEVAAVGERDLCRSERGVPKEAGALGRGGSGGD